MNLSLSKLKRKRNYFCEPKLNLKKYRAFMCRLYKSGAYIDFTGRTEFNFRNSTLYAVSEQFLPHWIGNNLNTGELWIRNSSITTIKGLELCYHLERLFLCKNKLGEVPVLGNKLKLTYLNLSWNEIQTLDGDQLEQCRNLKYLNLWANPITTIKNIHKLKKLQELWLPYEILLSNDIQDMEWPNDLGAIYFVSMPLLQMSPSSQYSFKNIPPVSSLDAFIPDTLFLSPWDFFPYYFRYGHIALAAFFKEDRCPYLLSKLLRGKIYAKRKMNLDIKEDLELLQDWFANAKPCCRSCGAPLEFQPIYWSAEEDVPEWECSCGISSSFYYLFDRSGYLCSTLRIGAGD